MIARVLVSEAAAEGARLTVPADEAQHLVRVLRLGPGAALRVFNGRGGEWDATLCEASKQRAVVELGLPRQPAAETRIRYTLAIAVLKGDGTDDVVRDAVMLGVADIRPFTSARTEVSRDALARAHRRQRWERVAVASAKQCGRAVVPVVHDAVDVATLWARQDVGLRLLLVEPSAIAIAVAPAALARPDAACLAVGPEGGWTEDEVRAAVAGGWQPLRLGARVLRASAAPLVGLAACQAVWGDE